MIGKTVGREQRKKQVLSWWYLVVAGYKIAGESDGTVSPGEKDVLLRMDVYGGLPNRLAGENGFKDKGMKVMSSQTKRNT